LHEKWLYLSPELVSPFEKSGEVALWVNLWITEQASPVRRGVGTF
jgi:hypothetical protein